MLTLAVVQYVFSNIMLWTSIETVIGMEKVIKQFKMIYD